MSIFDLMSLISRLESDGDIAADAAVIPVLQADLNAFGDDMKALAVVIDRMGTRAKKVAADCTPFVLTAHKIQVALKPAGAAPGVVDSGPGFDGHSGP